MKSVCVSLTKFGETINEDAALAKDGIIAISDGAGGGGVFAEEWSRFLLEHLPDTPLTSFLEFDQWVDGIWEFFYNQHEVFAQLQGGMFLDKFYDEGSFATLTAVWKVSESECQWMSYGDSVSFCYDRKSHQLQHSFTSLKDFNQPPHLINTNNPLKEDGFRSGVFNISKDTVVFAASDALAHYILMMSEVCESGVSADNLNSALSAGSRNSNIIRSAEALKGVSFERDVLDKLLRCANNKGNFKQHLQALYKKGLLGLDDYSLAILGE